MKKNAQEPETVEALNSIIKKMDELGVFCPNPRKVR
jgi:hypothetical protein